jgi:hypothetical protein
LKQTQKRALEKFEDSSLIHKAANEKMDSMEQANIKVNIKKKLIIIRKQEKQQKTIK